MSILKHREKQIEHLAYHDPLTGLPNRALFKQRIERALADAAQSGATVAVLCLDLDRFKHVNDSLGHMAGDELLKTAGERFRDCLREEDTVARLGGDEFGIVLVSHNAFEHATHVATRILASLGRPMSFSGHEIVSGTSIGIATSATDGTEPERLIKAADMALYRAKADGRATYRFFEAEMDARAQARSMLEMDLRQAVARNQFELHYQPQVEMERHSIIGFEALVRWRHPERGLVLPDEFIPLAEETGVINRLGEWVLRQACSDAKDWPSSIKLAVNVSPAQFRNRDLPQVVARVLKRTGFPPERLELEITESLLLEDVAANLALLQELKNLGVRIAMDDFGTGYSSLGNLRSFPFDKIKIDRSFMASLDRNPDSEAIVQAVLGLGQSLRIQTCAEGVETEGQVNYLVTHGCDEAQGYYYSRPRPIAEIGELLEKGFTAPAAQITFVD